MQSSLALTALLMGVAGGPHCVAMCGAACAGIGHSAGSGKTGAMWRFQFGRVLGYSALGGLAAASMQGLGWLTVQSAALRPVWTLFHAATHQCRVKQTAGQEGPKHAHQQRRTTTLPRHQSAHPVPDGSGRLLQPHRLLCLYQEQQAKHQGRRVKQRPHGA